MQSWKIWISLASAMLGVACSSDSSTDSTAANTEELGIFGPAQCEPNRGLFRQERYEFPVTLLNGTHAKIVGYLYYQGLYRGKTLLVGVHGATYNHKYWAAPSINDHVYSFACYMARQNYSILAIDLLGSGESTGQGQIDGDAISFDDSKAGITQVVNQLRNRNNPIGNAFKKIVLVGHSMGSEAVIGVQAASHPADALVVTGWSHVPPPGGLNLDLSPFLGTPYVTLPPPVRQALMYGPSADPDMISYDNANLADRLPRSELLTSFGLIFQAALTGANAVTGNVLVQLGENDLVYPSVNASAEVASYPHARVTMQTLPTTGHCFNLHPENRTSWEQMDNWLHRSSLDCE